MWAGAWCAHAQAPAPAPAPATPPPPAAPNPQDVKQVNVSVKIVEFQTTKGVESGLSAYFLHRDQKRGFSHVSMGNGTLRSADITFPTNTASAITVFLDQLHIGEGDLEVMLQGLVDQDRAFILSQPKAMVTVSSPIPTTIQTTQRIPYENTVVVGATAVQTTAFRDTGVSLTVQAPEIIDDDGNPTTADDTYIKLLISAAVNEEGQRIVVALDDRMAAQGIFGQASNAIKVPEFVSRSVATSVWVRHGQVLLLGGLYRNTKNKSLSTLPWLTQSEDLVMGLADKVLPTESLGSPLSSTVGDRTTNEGRRELVFLIKAELWKPAYTVFRDLTMGEEPSADGKKKPSLTGVIQGITDIPKGLVQGIRGDESQSNTVESGIGGGSK
jgi:Flp pilus assembly secretin CpaC